MHTSLEPGEKRGQVRYTAGGFGTVQATESLAVSRREAVQALPSAEDEMEILYTESGPKGHMFGASSDQRGTGNVTITQLASRHGTARIDWLFTLSTNVLHAVQRAGDSGRRFERLSLEE